MYVVDQNGKNRCWRIGYNGHSNRLFTQYGEVGGPYQTKSSLVELASKDTLVEQALLQARDKYNLKFRNKGYRPEGHQSVPERKIQLAKPYIPPMTEKTPKGNWRRSNIGAYPVCVQPKLDGIRARTRRNNGAIELLSRSNIQLKWLDHIREESRLLLSNLPQGMELDGEVFNHTMNFSEIQSAVNCSVNKSPNNGKMHYWIFDVVDDGTLNTMERMTMLENAFKKHRFKYLLRVPCTIATSHEHVKACHRAYTNAGYEGTIIRHMVQGNPANRSHLSLCKYRGGKNNNLLKYKDYFDEEGVVVSIGEGKGDYEGKAIIRVVDPRGNELDINPKGSFEYKSHLFANKEKYIGRLYKYKYQELSHKGVPRFPVGLVFVKGK